MLRSLLLSSALSLMAIGGAFAADLPSTKGEPVYAPPPPPPPTWTGFYLGVNGGYGGDRFVYPFDGYATEGEGEGATTISGNGNANITSSGFLAGGQIGYNYEFPASNFVAGIEADIDWSSIRGRLGASLNVGDVFSADADAGSHLQYLGTARARLGYAFGNILPYVTGGFAYGQTSSYYNVNYDVDGDTGAFGDSVQHFQTGWTAGAGLEYQITPNLSFKTEYLYVSLSPATLYSISGDIGDTGSYNFSLRERTTVNIVRAGLNYRFDWFEPPAPAPVVAKY
ncbi:outer membrane immunogenic protein [Methylovirgula ligni]|uniref:Outer membrane immunogenic protein n=1 Tax=Methylovirgula ligni TaxID=569860 RepID=A0A3D9Z371_9HYPH|nr:outer membrane beta-barrel protein [Methylovirgula ligni]REF89531.1 outer membrane immunogenic protein [Methylovirgula ligni]